MRMTGEGPSAAEGQASAMDTGDGHMMSGLVFLVKDAVRIVAGLCPAVVRQLRVLDRC